MYSTAIYIQQHGFGEISSLHQLYTRKKHQQIQTWLSRVQCAAYPPSASAPLTPLGLTANWCCFCGVNYEPPAHVTSSQSTYYRQILHILTILLERLSFCFSYQCVIGTQLYPSFMDMANKAALL